MSKQTVIVRSSIVFDASDVLTTEKKTDAIAILPSFNGIHRISVYKPAEDTAGDMTINVYNVENTDGTNYRDHLAGVFVVEKTAGAETDRSFIVTGLSNNIKIGAYFAADSGAITPYFEISTI